MVEIRLLTGTWDSQCEVCGTSYSQHVGSTPCCGSVASVVNHVPAPDDDEQQRAFAAKFTAKEEWPRWFARTEMMLEEHGESVVRFESEEVGTWLIEAGTIHNSPTPPVKSMTANYCAVMERYWREITAQEAAEILGRLKMERKLNE